MPVPRNDPKDPILKFCRALEELRRTDTGALRVRSSKELVAHFFPHDERTATDRLFRELPPDVRGPIVSAWGIRGAKAALRDDDERTARVVHDAFVAGDIDADAFEEGVSAETLTAYVPLSDWWSFWRGGRIAGAPTQRALAVARDLGLFDDRWFLTHVDGRGGRLRGTDTVCETLGKEQIVGWIRNVHASGDGSPAGLVAALGWETILAKTSQEALLFALDALAKELGLVRPDPAAVLRPSERELLEGAADVASAAFAENAFLTRTPPPPRPSPKTIRESELPPLAGPDDMGWAGGRASAPPSAEAAADDPHERATMVGEVSDVHDRPTSVAPPPPPPGAAKPPLPPRR